jgi:hypothetical protein
MFVRVLGIPSITLRATPPSYTRATNMAMVHGKPESPRPQLLERLSLGVFDAGVMCQRATDVGEGESHQQVATLNLIADRPVPQPLIDVGAATCTCKPGCCTVVTKLSLSCTTLRRYRYHSGAIHRVSLHGPQGPTTTLGRRGSDLGV